MQNLSQLIDKIDKAKKALDVIKLRHDFGKALGRSSNLDERFFDLGNQT